MTNSWIIDHIWISFNRFSRAKLISFSLRRFICFEDRKINTELSYQINKWWNFSFILNTKQTSIVWRSSWSISNWSSSSLIYPFSSFSSLEFRQKQIKNIAKHTILIGWVRKIEEKNPVMIDVNHFWVFKSPNSIPRAIIKTMERPTNIRERP